MAVDDLDDEIDMEHEEAERERAAEEARKAAAKQRLVLIVSVVLAAFLGFASGGAATYFAGIGAAPAEEEKEAAADTPSFFHELPLIHTNLSSARCRGLYIKLQVIAEMGSEEDVQAMKNAQQLIMDQLQEFIRGQTRQDVAGREGTDNVRANVLAIISDAVQPVKVRNVLFKEFLLQ